MKEKIQQLEEKGDKSSERKLNYLSELERGFIGR